ncbi:LysE family translocator [Maritimibacter sp. DP4N28-5]|uniref:LysE family translocator n=2 Tax=Maritimibacter dapengensis TaxID=2836868 RepID=A0ABS6T5B2_9RHOB|nr:LysE family translocator [Maritimibacter dapengensis]
MLETFIALIVFLAPLAYSPGPGNLFFAANGARFGFRATLPANVGYHAATWLVTIAIGLGFLALVENVPGVFAFIRMAGAAYVLWLAAKLIRSGAIEDGSAAQPAGFRDGVVLLLLNPKAYAIIALMFSQFLGPNFSGNLAAVLFISTVFTLNNCTAFVIWTLIGDRLAAVFRNDRQAAVLNVVLGLALAGVAIWMLLP